MLWDICFYQHAFNLHEFIVYDIIYAGDFISSFKKSNQKISFLVVRNETCPMRVQARMNRFPIRCCLYSSLTFFYQNIQEGKRVTALQFFGESDVIMHAVEGIKENVQRTHVVDGIKYVIHCNQPQTFQNRRIFQELNNVMLA